MYRVIFLFFAMVALSCQALDMSQKELILGKATEMTLKSAVLNEQRNILVHLPEGYLKNSNKSYPTLYLLDGERHLNHTILAYRLYRELEKVPDIIIVAIPNIMEDGIRERDLYHQRDKFRMFIEKEVMGAVNDTFRTNGDDALYGHSLAAFFTLDSLAASPELFDRYIAASPPLQRHEESIYKAIAAHALDNKKFLYFTLGSAQDEGEAVTRAYYRFAEQLGNKAPDNLSWRHEVLADQSHISNYYITLFKGLAEVYH